MVRIVDQNDILLDTHLNETEQTSTLCDYEYLFSNYEMMSEADELKKRRHYI